MKYEDKKQVISAIKQRFKKGLPLNISAVKRACPELITFVYSQTPHWGWYQAVTEAGIDYSSINMELLDYITCAVCGEKLSRLGTHIGRLHGLGIAAYKKKYGEEIETFAEKQHQMRFVKNVAAYPPLIPHWEPFVTKEYVLDRIHFHLSAGRSLLWRDVEAYDRQTFNGAEKRFGSWPAALKAAGLNPKSVRPQKTKWSADKILKTLQSRFANNEALSPTSLKRLKSTFVNNCDEYFGSYEAALTAAGLEPKVVKTSPYYLFDKALQDQFSIDLCQVAALPLRRRLKAIPNLREKYDGMLMTLEGSWAKACDQLDIPQWKILNAPFNLKRLEELYPAYLEAQQVGISEKWLKTHYDGLFQALIKRFGTLKEANRFFEKYEEMLALDPFMDRVDYRVTPMRDNEGYGGVTLGKRPNYTSRKAVITEIKRLHRAGHPLNITAVKRYDPALIDFTYQTEPFWGWKQALEDAGIDYSEIHIELMEEATCLECGEHYRMLSTHLITQHDMNPEIYREIYGRKTPVLSEHMCQERQRFKSLERACCYPHWEPFYTKEYLLDRLNFYRSFHIPIHSRGVQKLDPSMRGAMHQWFGSWDEAVKLIGLDPQTVRQLTHKNWSQEFIVECLKKRAALGFALNHAGLREDNEQLFLAIRRHFNSHDEALEAAGFDPNEVRINHAYTPEDHEELIQAMYEFIQKPLLERRKTYRYFREKYLGHAIHFYKSIRKAAKALHLPYWKFNLISYAFDTKADVLAALAEIDEPDRTENWLKEHCNVLRSVAEFHFGTVMKAVVALGKAIRQQKLNQQR